METKFATSRMATELAGEQQISSLLDPAMILHDDQSCISDTGFPPDIPGNKLARFFEGAANDSAHSLTA